MVLAGCRPRPTPERWFAECLEAPQFGPVEVFEATLRAKLKREMSPKLKAKLRANPYAFFRAFSEPYVEAVCVAFGSQIWDMPTVNVHGDAHLTQYAVTAHSQGLEDFDSSGSGPAVIDWVRFLASYRVACSVRPEICAPLDTLDGIFFDAYLEGLAGEIEAPTPSVVSKIRARPSKSQKAFLEWAETLMVPIEDEETKRKAQDLARTLGSGFHPVQVGSEAFEIVRVGKLRGFGIGSFADEKYLLRLQGPTAMADDDIIAEAKVQLTHPGVSCLRGGHLRSLAAASRIGRRTPEALGYIAGEEMLNEAGIAIWIQSWNPTYAELDLEDLDGPEALQEVVADVGRQLGEGHVKAIAEPLTPQLRRLQRQWVQKAHIEATQLADQLVRLTLDRWKTWRR